MRNEKATNIKEQTVEQKIFSSRFVERIFIDLAENEDSTKYEESDPPVQNGEVPRGGSDIYRPENIELLLPDGNYKKDFENTKIIYNAFRSINPTQASDPRFWTYLTHVDFWEYMKYRWPVKSASDKLKFIAERYLLRSINLRTLTHNGISRLWWFGHLTYDKNRTDPWELTEILLRSQDLPTSLFERALGSNRNIRIGVLEFFKENPQLITSKSIQEILRVLNLVGGVKNLAFLEIEEVKSILNKIK